MSRDLATTIANGFPTDTHALPVHLRAYWAVRDVMSSIDGVPLVGHRAVIPSVLRGEVLDQLHSAHQGVSSLKARARTSAYWPTNQHAIQQRRAQCSLCNRITPSYPVEPLPPSPATEYPFQAVCDDFFQSGRPDYLVYVNRYTAWVNIAQMPGDSPANNLIQNLRLLFTQFAVPSELASDGGHPFTSQAVRTLLQRWGEHLRSSSAQRLNEPSV